MIYNCTYEIIVFRGDITRMLAFARLAQLAPSSLAEPRIAFEDAHKDA